MLNTQAVILVWGLITEDVGYLIKQNSIGASKKIYQFKMQLITRTEENKQTVESSDEMSYFSPSSHINLFSDGKRKCQSSQCRHQSTDIFQGKMYQSLRYLGNSLKYHIIFSPFCQDIWSEPENLKVRQRVICLQPAEAQRPSSAGSQSETMSL